MLRQLRTRRACLEGVTLLLQKPQKHLQVRNGAEALKSITPNPRPRNVILSRRKPKVCNCRQKRLPDASILSRRKPKLCNCRKKRPPDPSILSRRKPKLCNCRQKRLPEASPEARGCQIYVTVVKKAVRGSHLQDAAGQNCVIVAKSCLRRLRRRPETTFRVPGPPRISIDLTV